MKGEAVRRHGERRERIHASPLFRDGAFHNPSGLGPGLQGNPLPVMRDFVFGQKLRRPTGAIPVHSPHSHWAKPSQSGFRVTWLGHSTVLLELGPYRVLTDPVFGDRASPVSFAGPKRFHAVPAAIDTLPPLTAVLLSHDHYDHLCAQSIRQLAALQVPIVTALGVGIHLEQLGVLPHLIHELDWNQSLQVAGVSFTATPAQHFSGRGIANRNQTLWASWVIESDHHKVFFSGDTGLTPEFAQIGRKFGPFDLVLLEVGAYDPAWGHIHLGPENALTAFRMLRGDILLPVHWATFDLALHPWDQPAETLYRLAPQANTRLATPQIGAPFEPAHLQNPQPWWRQLPTTVAHPTPELLPQS